MKKKIIKALIFFGVLLALISFFTASKETLDYMGMVFIVIFITILVLVFLAGLWDMIDDMVGK